MTNLFPTYARWEVEPKYAKDSIIIDINDKQYIDFTSGIGVCNLGHRPDNVQKKVTEQLEQFWHLSNLYPTKIQEEAATILAQNANLQYVFFSNSGAEANEGAIKLARKATSREKIITFKQSFHGRTFATMSATGQDKIKEGYGTLLNGFVHVPYNDIESFKKEIDERTAAVIVEVVQGEGGVHPAEVEFIKMVEKLCHQNGALLIIDEIQTGIGRTGKKFAYEHYGLSPDIITVAKGLGSGFPIGAIIGRQGLETVFTPGSHGSTFGGNPLSVSAAIATMESIFNEDFLNEVTEKGNYLLKQLQEKLANKQSVVAVRGLGLMIGIELNSEVSSILKLLRDNNVLLLQAGPNVIRLLPPLTVNYEHIDIVINKIVETLK